MAIAAVALAAVAAAFGPASAEGESQPAVGETALAQLPEPVLDGVDAGVAQHLRSLRQEIEAALAAPSGPDRELAEQLGDLGGLYHFFGFTAPAEAALANARTLAPGDFRWPYLLALVRHNAGDVEGAGADYEAALALRPRYVPALVRLGQVRLAEHRLDDAEALFRRALEVQPTAAAARFGLGRAAAERGDAEAAAGHFEAVLELQPEASSVRYPLAQAYRQLGRLDDVKAQLAAVGAAEVKLPDPVLLRVQGLATGSSVHFVRGRRALAQGDQATAVAELRLARDADPANVPVRRALGLAYRRSGDAEAAVEQYRAAAELEPANPLNHQDLALALFDTGDLEGAAESFRRALELDPTFADAHLGLGIAAGRLGRPTEALSHFDRALELDPTSAATRFERAMALQRLGRLGDAAGELRAVVAADPDHAAARVNLAALLEAGGDVDGAERESAAVLGLEPPAPLAARARLIRGRSAERRGALGDAAEHYAAAAGLDPALPPAHFRLGSARAAVGDLDGAAASYAVGLAASPAFWPARLALASALIRGGRDAEARDRLLEGLRAAPSGRRGGEVALARLSGLLLAGSADPAVRDPARALELARAAHGAAPNQLTGQVLAVALAAAGRFEEAADVQGRLVEALEQAGQTALLAAARSRLTLYQRGEAARAPWRDDPALLDPVTLPLPPAGGRGVVE